MNAVLALQPASLVEVAKGVLAAEAAGLRALAASLDGVFDQAVGMLAACTGRVVVSGMGKSGLVGRKIGATLASTGTPALFVHPGEASHGDLGMIVQGDAVPQQLAGQHGGDRGVGVDGEPVAQAPQQLVGQPPG